MDKAWTLSVIIPTFNRCEGLRFMLESFLSQHEQLFKSLICELVIVDSCSTDGTETMLKGLLCKYKKLNLDIRYVGSRLYGAAGKVVEGIQSATGTHILVLTDEAFTVYNYLDEAMSAISEDEIIGIPCFGPADVRKRHATDTPRWTVDGFPQLPFLLALRSSWEKISEQSDQYVHYVDRHLTRATWDAGYTFMTLKTYLRYPPILKLDPESGHTDAGAYIRLYHSKDQQTFAELWPDARNKRAMRNMLRLIDRIRDGNETRYQLLTCGNQVLVVKRSDSREINCYFRDASDKDLDDFVRLGLRQGNDSPDHSFSPLLISTIRMVARMLRSERFTGLRRALGEAMREDSSPRGGSIT